MDLSLTSEQRMMREVAREFVDREIVPHAREWDRREAVDCEIVPRLGELGMLGATIPEQFGGTPVDHLAYCLLLEELGRGDSSVRGIVSVSLGLVAKTILAHGDEDQRRAWLPGLCRGGLLGCFALTEPEAGSSPADLRTRAVPSGEDWLLSGEKTFITNGTWADVALVFARTGDGGGEGRHLLRGADRHARLLGQRGAWQARPSRPGDRRARARGCSGPRQRPPR